MNEPAAIRATFADWRTVKGRKQLQIILEVPLEQQGDVLRMLGAPNPSDPAWVALALLQEPAKAAQEPAKDKRKWADLPPSQQAAIRCGEKAFHLFLASRDMNAWYAASDAYNKNAKQTAAKIIRQYCDVTSRSDIHAGEASGRLWDKVELDYQLWLRGNG